MATNLQSRQHSGKLRQNILKNFSERHPGYSQPVSVTSIFFNRKPFTRRVFKRNAIGKINPVENCSDLKKEKKMTPLQCYNRGSDDLIGNQIRSEACVKCHLCNGLHLIRDSVSNIRYLEVPGTNGCSLKRHCQNCKIWKSLWDLDGSIIRSLLKARLKTNVAVYPIKEAVQYILLKAQPRARK